jgi:hypothetical protein
MNELLLVLILLTDPSARPAADAVVQRLTDQGGARVVVGADAMTQLKERGITDADLMAQPAVGLALTTKERKLAVVRIDRQLRGGNIVIDSIVWAGGRREGYVAISGTPKTVPSTVPGAPPKIEAAEPLDAVARGVGNILTPWMAAGGANPSQEVEGQLAGLSDRADWSRIIALTETLPQPSPRVRYYRILALHHVERHADAETAYQEFLKVAPHHLLLTPLEQLLHPSAKKDGEIDINNATPVDDGSNVMH